MEKCPLGDDPLTHHISGSTILRHHNEKQTIRCIATSGSFSVRFRGQASANIPFNAKGKSYRLPLGSGATSSVTFGSNTIFTGEDFTLEGNGELLRGDIVEVHSSSKLDVRNYTVIGTPSSSSFTISQNIGMDTGHVTIYKVMPSVQTILEQIPTIQNVKIGMYIAGTDTPETTACSSTGVDIDVEFLSEFGDLPLMTTVASLGGGTVTVTEKVQGTKKNVECSNRGKCDRKYGVCSCFGGYCSSNSHGAKGHRGDCGAVDVLAVVGAEGVSFLK